MLTISEEPIDPLVFSAFISNSGFYDSQIVYKNWNSPFSNIYKPSELLIKQILMAVLKMFTPVFEREGTTIG